MQISSFCGDGGTHVTDDLINADQKVLDWLTYMFLGEAETGINSRFGVMGFSMSDTIWGLWCYLKNIHQDDPSLTVLLSDCLLTSNKKCGWGSG